MRIANFKMPLIRRGLGRLMMIVPEAANMPPTPWQTEIQAPGIWAAATPRIWRTLFLQRVHAVHAGMNIGKAAAIGVERDPRAAGPAGRPGDAGTVLRSAMKAPASPRGMRYKAEILEAVDRQTEEGVVDHQMVDVVAGGAGLGKGCGAGDAEGPRGSAAFAE